MVVFFKFEHIVVIVVKWYRVLLTFSTNATILQHWK